MGKGTTGRTHRDESRTELEQFARAWVATIESCSRRRHALAVVRILEPHAGERSTRSGRSALTDSREGPRGSRAACRRAGASSTRGRSPPRRRSPPRCGRRRGCPPSETAPSRRCSGHGPRPIAASDPARRTSGHARASCCTSTDDARPFSRSRAMPSPTTARAWRRRSGASSATTSSTRSLTTTPDSPYAEVLPRRGG